MAGPPQNEQRPSSPDFLFGQPHGWIAVRGSWTFARAYSDLFHFVTDRLTIDKRDFDAPGIAIDVGIVLTPRLDAVLGLEYSETTTTSEYRDFVDNNLLPIVQDTRLKVVNLSGGLRVNLAPRGRAVSRFAWVPRGVTPYVGGGAGLVWYEFKQTGDFVDFVDLGVFSDVFWSKRWAPSAHAFGGVDVKLRRWLFLTFEGRYLWAAAELGSDFVGFDPIDLAGFRLGAGLNVLF